MNYKNRELRKLNIALMNRELDKSGLCPSNHEVEYFKGWFFIDDDKGHHRPDLTHEARNLYSDGVKATYSKIGNTFFINR